ncbi:MAG: MFS transporter [Gammaproteobacteria bacterium]|nr:MFS transporter [Gammaproteobacteria bacterium]
MSTLQIVAVALTVCLNALDGFDVLSISFASPGIASEWGIDRAQLGIVLSMELIGMAIGSILLGNVADRIGRRPTILGCLTVMVFGMYLATTAKGLVVLSMWRVITGLGIGGMLAAINAVAAEFANARRKHLSVALMTIGYPLGGVVGGLLASKLLQTYDWRSVFYLGSCLTAIMVPLVYFLIPESVHWQTRKQPAGALENINKTLRRMGHQVIAALPHVSADARKQSSGDVFGSTLIATTIIVTAAYFFHIMTFYFILKWVPKIVADLGFAPSAAGNVLVWVNAGGALGGAIFGFLTLKYDVKALTVGVFVLSSMAVAVFGYSLFGEPPEDLQMLSFICLCAGFCTNAGIVGMYALFAHAFPTHARAFGTGFAIGIGRGGSVLAPIIAGFLFESGIPVPVVAMIMAIGSLVGAIVLLFLKINPEHEQPVGATAGSAGNQSTASAPRAAAA